MESTTTRFLFADIVAAASALIELLSYARSHDDQFQFYGLNVSLVMSSGLVVEGDVSGVAAAIAALPGVTRHDE